MSNQLKRLLFFIVVISGALCTVEDYVIMSQCAHNKAIHLAAEGTVSVTDISQTQNITIVGLPDYVNNEFKIALYAKETQRYLCFNDNWKLVGMKELRDTCYFNETIVHGYFVFRSVVDLQRRVGFTHRGKPVGPKKTVNDACYLFTKIESDQFFHQHSRPKWRETAPIQASAAAAAAPTAASSSSSKSSMSAASFSATASASAAIVTATTSQRASNNNRKTSRNKNNRNNNKNRNQNQKLQQLPAQQQHDNGHNSSKLSSTRQQLGLDQHEQHTELTRERVQHQVRHHHNDPTLIARRQQHEHKQKRRQRTHQQQQQQQQQQQPSLQKQRLNSSKSQALPTTTAATSNSSAATAAAWTTTHAYRQQVVIPTSVVDKSTAATAIRNMLTTTTTVANKRKGRRRKSKKRQPMPHVVQKSLAMLAKDRSQQSVGVATETTPATDETSSNSEDNFIGSSMSTVYDIAYNTSDWTTWLATSTPTSTFEAYSLSSTTFDETEVSSSSSSGSTQTTFTDSTSSTQQYEQDASDLSYESNMLPSTKQHVSTTTAVTDKNNSNLSTTDSISMSIEPTATATTAAAAKATSQQMLPSSSATTTIATASAADVWSTFMNELDASNETANYANYDDMLPTTYETKVNFETAAAAAADDNLEDVATTTSIESSETTATSEQTSEVASDASSSSSSTDPLSTPYALTAAVQLSTLTAVETETQLSSSTQTASNDEQAAGTTFASPTLATLMYNKWHTTQQHTVPAAAVAASTAQTMSATLPLATNSAENMANASLTDYNINSSINQQQHPHTPHKNSRHRNSSSNNNKHNEHQQQQLLTRSDSNTHDMKQHNQRPKQHNSSNMLLGAVSASTTTAKSTTLQTTSAATSSTTPTAITTTKKIIKKADSLYSVNKNINNSNLNNTLTEATATVAAAAAGSTTTMLSSSAIATTTTKKTLRKATQKLLATPYHQLTYVRNDAGDIDIDNIDNISVYPDLFGEGNDSEAASLRHGEPNAGSIISNSRFTFVSGYLPTSSTAILPESILIGKMKINNERKRLLRLRRYGNYA